VSRVKSTPKEEGGGDKSGTSSKQNELEPYDYYCPPTGDGTQAFLCGAPLMQLWVNKP